MKNKREFGKSRYFFDLMFKVFQMVLRFFMFLADDFPPQKIEIPKLMRNIMIFCY